MSVPQGDEAPDEGHGVSETRSGGRLAKVLAGSSLRRAAPLALLLCGVFSASVVLAQVNGMSAGTDPVDWTETDKGIPVTDKLTIEKCGSCHTPDDKGNLSRISWVRTTPEGWSQTIKRMVRLNNAPIEPDEARQIVKYLANSHGLAPEESKPVMYLAENRILDETIIPNETVRQACASCHAFAQPMSSRRSKREWALLQNMHVALYSQAEAQYNRGVQGAPPTSGPDGKPLTPGQVALGWLAENAPLNTPEWAAWSPRVRTPRLEGKWLVTANLPGKGPYVGEMTVVSGKDRDRFTTVTTLRSLTTGAVISRKGEGVVYAGNSWRGASSGAGASDQPDDPKSASREAMWFSPDLKTAQGRWYWGAYHEFGFDVSLTRASADPTVAAVTPSAVKTGSKGVEIHIYGDSLPEKPSAQDIDLGGGLKVTKVLSASPREVVVSVDVADTAQPGLRDVGVKGAVLVGGLPVYDTVAYLKVTPETALARLGGLKFDKGFQQFEAIGYAAGPDGKAHTSDDFAIGAVPVSWSLDEFRTVTYDDDASFVGSLSATALFTPSVEGPNPKRRFSRNNYGEVWVVATAKTAKDKHGKPLVGRAYLVVTVPAYKRIDQPEVSG